jgi:hypothetical protein
LGELQGLSNVESSKEAKVEASMNFITEWYIVSLGTEILFVEIRG